MFALFVSFCCCCVLFRESQTGAWDWTTHTGYDAKIGTDAYHKDYNTTYQLEQLVETLYTYYVQPDPTVRIIYRPGEAWITPIHVAVVRRHTTYRMEAIGRRIGDFLLNSKVGANIEWWGVDMLRSYHAHSLDDYPIVGAMCPDAHSSVVHLEFENQLLYNTMCNNIEKQQHETVSTT
jgi:hypothetical protein